MDEVQARKEQAKKLKLAEELAIERKLEREREEMKQREAAEAKKLEDKNENRRLAAQKL